MNGTQTELDAATQPSAAPAPAAAPAAGAPSKSALMQMEGRGVVLTNVEQALIFAKAVMTSGLAPSAFKTPEAVLVAIQYDMELGLPPLSALNSVYVVRGRPSLWGDAVPGVCAKVIESYKDEEIGEKGKDSWGWKITVKRKDRADPIIRTYTVDDAKTAKIWQKRGSNGEDTPWITNPGRMLFMRARTYAFRDLCPDIMRGIYTVEEIRDIPEEPKNVTHSLDEACAGEGAAK